MTAAFSFYRVLLFTIICFGLLTILLPTSAGAQSADSFRTTWQSDNTGSSDDDQITIPTTGSGYNYTVYFENVASSTQNGTTTGLTGDATIDLPEPGTYIIEISGTFPQIFFNGVGDEEKILTVERWGNNPWTSMDRAFRGATNLTITAADAPDLSAVTDMSQMFDGATSLNQSLNSWDVSNVTDMGGLFQGTEVFDQPLNLWNVSNVTDMSNMFSNAADFNQDISSWDVSSTTDMSAMFNTATDFNQPLNAWGADTQNVQDMSSMFFGATLFNQPIDNWETGSVTNMQSMFNLAYAFDQDISSWDVSKVENMSRMFRGVFAFIENSGPSSFNQDISSWDVSSVTDMGRMFEGADVFDQPIGGWGTTTANVENMRQMFDGASAFNQDISSWDVSSVTTMSNMFNGAAAFNSPLNGWGTTTANVQSMDNMFTGATLFNQDLDDWDVSGLTNAGFMFSGAPAFNGALNGWAASTTNVTNMSGMFQNTAFNQPIDNWNVDSVQSFNLMFNGASSFNQDLSSWDTAAAINFRQMFDGASAFNQDISSWDVSEVTSMTDMLPGTSLDVVNYDALLLDWSRQSVQSGVDFGASGLEFCGAVNERDRLDTTFGWTLSGDSQDCLTSVATTSPTEGAATSSYTLALDSAPSGNVEVTIGVGNAAVVLSTSSLIFTPGNFSDSQEIIVTAVEDSVFNGASIQITHIASSSDATFDGIGIASVFVQILDNDGIRVSTTTASAIEGGANGSYDITLLADPTAQVDVAFNFSNSEVSVSPTTLSFGNAATQTVTVIATDDDLDDSDLLTTISHIVTSADSNFNGVALGSVIATATDDDVSQLIFSQAAVNATEGAANGTYTVRLDAEPTDTVTVTIGTTSSEFTVAPTLLTFTTGDYDTPQTVTVTAVDDFLDDGNLTGSTTHSVTSAGDTIYNALAVAEVGVTAVDDDVPQVIVSSPTVSATEGGSTGSYTVRLGAQPSASVEVVLSTSTSEVTLSTTSITFTTSSFNTAETVTVTAVDDAVIDGNLMSTITHTASTTDGVYDGLTAEVVATAIDNDASSGSSGGGSSGGGGGGSSSANDIETGSPTTITSTTAVLTGTVADENGWEIFFVLSSEDKTPLCNDTGGDYITHELIGTFGEDTTFSDTVTGLTAETKYYYKACGRDEDGDIVSGTTEQFTTAVAGETIVIETDITDDEAAQRAALIAQIRALLGETGPGVVSINPVSTTIPATFTFTANFSFVQPEVNDPFQVQQLANFLNDFEGETLVVDGTYGADDLAAVKRFQEKYRREILDIWGLEEATGYVGITTRLKMNFLLKGQSAQCPVFTEFHGGKNDPITFSAEIGEVQKILTELGMYRGPINNTWGPQVHESMITFQETFREVMLDPWNISQGTGRQYKTTNKFLNYFAGCDTGDIELDGEGVFSF